LVLCDYVGIIYLCGAFVGS